MQERIPRDGSGNVGEGTGGNHVAATCAVLAAATAESRIQYVKDRQAGGQGIAVPQSKHCHRTVEHALAGEKRSGRGGFCQEHRTERFNHDPGMHSWRLVAHFRRALLDVAR